MSCSSKYSFLDTPDFLKASLHTVTLVSTPVYALGFYCILFKTPKQMASVKWHLFILHFWIIHFDFLTGVFVVPQLIPPAAAGVTHGLFRSLGVSPAIQTMLIFVNACYIFIATIAIYENRFFLLCQFHGKQFWAIGRRFWLFSHHFLVPVIMIPMYYLIPDQDYAIQKVFEVRFLHFHNPPSFQQLPCLPSFIVNDQLFVFALDPTFHFTAAVLGLSVAFLETGWFISKLIRNGRSQMKSKTISKKLYQMNQQFMLAMFLQMTVPLICIGFPVCYIIAVDLIVYYNQAASNICVITSTIHGLVSTTVMIIVHKPYRLAVLSMIRKDKSGTLKVFNV